MKKIHLNKGLQINKEAISKLQEQQMTDIKGGNAYTSCKKKSCTGLQLPTPEK